MFNRVALGILAFYLFVPIDVSAQIGGKAVFFGLTLPEQKQTITTKPSLSEQYIAVDSYAQSAPEFNHLSRLVDYLIRPYQKNEHLKARVLFAWMVYHLSYDQFKADNLAGKTRDRKPRVLNSGDAFKTRIGVCGDFADLFVKMANRAGLKAVRIDGVAGEKLTRATAPAAAHAWNAVRIDKEWYLLDVTWAMGGDFAVFQEMKEINDYKKAVRERRKHTEELSVSQNRKMNNKWFLTPPEIMIETHFPNNIKWQLLDNPITPRDVFEKNEGETNTHKNFNATPVKMIIPTPSPTPSKS